MQRDSLVDVAREQPFFKGIDAGHVEKMAAMASEVSFSSGEIVFREGEKSDFFYLILSGRVALEVCIPGRILRVQTLEEGDELGWSSFLEEETRRFQARSLLPVCALRFEGACLRKACAEDSALCHALEHRFLQVVSGRLQATLLQISDIYASEKTGHRPVSSKIAS